MMTRMLCIAKVVVFLALIGIYSNSVARTPGQRPKSRVVQNQIDSIQQWAHHFCDSVLGAVRGQLRNTKSYSDELKKLKNQFKGQLDSLKSYKFSFPDLTFPDLNGLSGYGYLKKPHDSQNGYIDDDGRQYFLKIVPPGVKLPERRVGNNIWLIDEESR